MTILRFVLGAAIILVAGLLSVTFAWSFLRGSGPLPSPGPLPHPVQRALDEPLDLPAPDGFTFTAVDDYEVEALIASRKRYRWDREAEVSPVDLLLVWGDAAAHGNPQVVSWSQRDRFGYWNWPSDGSLRLTDGGINSLAANTHIIPPTDDPATCRQILALRRGDHVRLRGYLVNIRADKGWWWKTSRARGDTWGGACEVFYVTEVERLG